jgi:hypothetical protein
MGIARKLAQNGVSLIGGVEYYKEPRRNTWRNDAMVALCTRWPGYASSVVFMQPKLDPAHDERKSLKKLKERLYAPRDRASSLPVYVHGGLCFGIILCSDLTNIGNRAHFQGHVDALFVLEWNPDVRTFSFLVESAAHDVHAFVVQVNNRRYGDSRIRVPYKIEHKRDLVRVKGGDVDYYVVGQIDYHPLRKFQRQSRSGGSDEFKPVPIGFAMSSRRRPQKRRTRSSHSGR